LIAKVTPVDAAGRATADGASLRVDLIRFMSGCINTCLRMKLSVFALLPHPSIFAFFDVKNVVMGAPRSG
jgi:hypothetical protein